MPGVVLPDVKAVVLAHIRSSLAARPEPFAQGVVVKGDLPDPRPERAVTVRDDGGSRLPDVRGVARLGINVWAKNEADATDLANLVSAIVAGAENVGPIRRASASRPMEVEDPSGQPNRYLTAELTVRGVSL